MAVVWAPNTPQSVVDGFEDQLAALNGADIDDVDAMRWTSTSTDPGPLGQGDATTLTWSIMDDGAEIGGFNGEPTSPSNLQTRLNTLYGSTNTWLPLFQQVFDRWEFLSGIDFVFEANDDGSPMGQVNVGQPSVRGDIRIGGHFIDGDANILAYNFFPGFGGDMVIDTADNFLDDLSNNSRVLRTIIAHEAGHGVGLRHSTPIVHQKLMEPNINLNFDGPQHDDALRIQRGYGDRYERNGGNDTAATAAPIGGLTAAPFVLGQATITPYDASDVDDYVGIDDDSDVDYYRFILSAATSVDVSVAPVGLLYGTGIHGEGNPELFNSQLQSDLRLAVLNADGTTERANVNATGLGGTESVINLALPAGQYFIRVTGAQPAGAQESAQLYTLTASSDLPATDTTPPTVTNRTPANGTTITTAATNIDITFSEPVTGVDVTDLVLNGAGAAGAVKAAPVNTSGNVWRFAVSNLQNGPVNVSLAPDAGDIEDAAGNDLAPTSWSFTVDVGDTTPPTVTKRAPANGTTITTAATNIDITFSEPVTGVDVTDLVLGGGGATGAVKAAPVNMGGNVWRFAVSGLKNGRVNLSLAPDAGDIEDAAGNDLARTSWSFMVNLPKMQSPPVLSPMSLSLESPAAVDSTGGSSTLSLDAAVIDQLLAGPENTWTRKSRTKLFV